MKAKLGLLTCILLTFFNAKVRGQTTVISAAEGEEHTVFVESDGSLWGVGENFQGQLGLGQDFYSSDVPQLVVQGGFDPEVTTVAAGSGFTLFLKSDGSLWGMGNNTSGQLGDGTTDSQFEPEMILPGGETTVTAIAAGNEHSLFIKSDGSLWVMGDDVDGDLGDGTNVVRSNAVMIVSSDVKAIAAGSYHSLFVKTDGSLWAMGANQTGEFGNGTTNSSNVPVMILPGGVSTVAAGEDFSLFIKTNGSLWAMGWDLVGELGDGGNNSNAVYTAEQIVSGDVTGIAAGDIFGIYLTSSGSIWGMGDDTFGELGDGNCCFSRYDRFTPEETVPGDVTAIAAGGAASIFIKSDGSLWGMGLNYGQLGPGVGNRTAVDLPVPIVPDLPFTASPTNGQVPLAVEFNAANVDTFGENIVTWEWNFGDGSSTNSQNPTHIYTVPGSYNVTLTAIDSTNHVVAGSGPDLITAEPTNLVYSVSKTNGLAPLYVQFSASRTDADGNSIVSWSWSFGDGGTSGLENATYTYETPGTYSVTLTAINSLGDNLTGTGPTNITVTVAPTLTYTATPATGPAPLSVQFMAPATDSLGNAIISWNWNFGDGVGSSTEQDPSYTYTSPDTYSPSLHVENSLGESFYATGPSIEALLPAVQFTACPATGNFPATVQFQAPSVDSQGNTIIDWNWDFGDGIGTSTLQNPTYVYTTPGVFVPTLNVDNNIGENINATGPTINLTAGTFNSGLVTNGGFETGDFTDWTLVSPNGNYATDVDTYQVLDGNYSADFYEEGSLDYISQMLPTSPGATYVLSFWLDSPDGMTPNEFLASWNGTNVFDQINMAAFGWTNVQQIVKATGSCMVLEFGGQDDPSDLGLDDVSVASAQPTLASVSLSGSNLVLSGANGVSGQTYCVLESTNVAKALNEWTPISTNVLCMSGPFSITVTNAVKTNVAQAYFTVELK